MLELRLCDRVNDGSDEENPWYGKVGRDEATLPSGD